MNPFQYRAQGMEISSINESLIYIIEELFIEIKDALDRIPPDHISYINLFHKNWRANQYNYLKETIAAACEVNPTHLLSFGFINSKPNCKPQCFHIDYEGKTETFFVPLVDVNDTNGTEYLIFKDKFLNLTYFDLLISLSNRFSQKNKLKSKLSELNIPEETYEFTILNAKKHSLIHMPSWIFHRGQTNLSGYSRPMFQIVFSKFDYKLCREVSVNDAELDEDAEVCKKILASRG